MGKRGRERNKKQNKQFLKKIKRSLGGKGNFLKGDCFSGGQKKTKKSFPHLFWIKLFDKRLGIIRGLGQRGRVGEL